MGMIGKLRRMKLRDQLFLSEIAKRIGLSRNTVKKWLKTPGEVVPANIEERNHDTRVSALRQ